MGFADGRRPSPPMLRIETSSSGGGGRSRGGSSSSSYAAFDDDAHPLSSSCPFSAPPSSLDREARSLLHTPPQRRLPYRMPPLIKTEASETMPELSRPPFPHPASLPSPQQQQCCEQDLPPIEALLRAIKAEEESRERQYC
jgi:hypothetical protein